MRIAYTADRIFTGTEWLTDHSLIVEEERILSLIPTSQVPAEEQQQQFAASFIAPAFIDLQLYGAGGMLLSAYPGTEALHTLRAHCADSGTAFCQPTIATNTIEVFHQCIDAVRQYKEEGGEGIIGLHLEGPWINAVKRGAHIGSLVRKPEVKEVKAMLDYGKGIITMVTLAPELCTREILELFLERGVTISAGHSNATYDEATMSFDNGITTATHLFNAMSAFQHRAPGLAGAVLDHSSVNASIIPDGHHVDFAAVRIAKKIMQDRLFVITDAVTATSIGPYPHVLVGDKYEADNILSGSSLTMIKAVRNLVNFAGIELAEALRMCSLYPARVIGLKEQGFIRAGGSARMVVINDNLEVQQLL